jgi:hypothetical protein
MFCTVYSTVSPSNLLCVVTQRALNRFTHENDTLAHSKKNKKNTTACRLVQPASLRVFLRMGSPGMGFIVNGSQMNVEMNTREDEDDYEGDDMLEAEYGAEEDPQDGAEIDLPDETPPPMPPSFYSNVDSFLTRPPPQVSAFAGKAAVESRVQLPNIASTSVKKKKASSKVKSRIQHTEQPDRRFDPSLLQEAFAYVDRIQQEVLVEEETEIKRLPGKSSSAPSLGRPAEAATSTQKLTAYQSGGPTKQKKQGKAAKQKDGGGLVRRLRSQTNADPDAAFSNLSASALENSGKKPAMDMSALISNFENGILLNKLKAELAASKNSIAESENFMLQLSKDYGFRQKR